MAKRKSTFKTIRGPFIPLSRIFLRHNAIAHSSALASKLFLDLLAQYNGFNNGDLCCTWKVLKLRGWRSRDSLDKAREELLEKKIIMKTRQGGRNKCCLFAITLFWIDDCNGKMDSGFKATFTPPGGWDK